ncbi:hypothetical protein V8F06_007483 [Rhypophila decipiens]
MARIDIIYERHPRQSWFEIAFVLALICTTIVVGIVMGAVSLAMAITLLSELGLILTYWVFGPAKTIPFGKTTVDGQQLMVRRPVIGFKSCERAFNSADEYMGHRVTTCHYQMALVRI